MLSRRCSVGTFPCEPKTIIERSTTPHPPINQMPLGRAILHPIPGGASPALHDRRKESTHRFDVTTFQPPLSVGRARFSRCARRILGVSSCSHRIRRERATSETRDRPYTYDVQHEVLRHNLLINSRLGDFAPSRRCRHGSFMYGRRCPGSGTLESGLERPPGSSPEVDRGCGNRTRRRRDMYMLHEVDQAGEQRVLGRLTGLNLGLSVVAPSDYICGVYEARPVPPRFEGTGALEPSRFRASRVACVAVFGARRRLTHVFSSPRLTCQAPRT